MNATPIFVSRIYESIVRPTIRNLSSTDKAFLEAMSVDGGEPSRMSDIAERMVELLIMRIHTALVSSAVTLSHRLGMVSS